MKILKDSLPRPRLSVAMIVRNEQEVLADSFASVRPIADEIVVLDTGSTDQTIAAAGRLGAVVRQSPWDNDFSVARNQCLQFAKGDWVLWLDAGERLTPDSALQLRQFLDEKAEPCKVYAIWVEAPGHEETISSEQVLQARLMPRGEKLRFEGRVRETLQPSIQAAGMGVGIAPGRIVRHCRQHDPARSRSRAQRDLSLAFKEAKELGETPARLLLASGEAHSMLGAQDKARVAFREAICSAERGSAEMLEAYYGLLTTYDGDSELRDAQLTDCVAALEVFPLDTQLLLAMGNYLLARDRPDLAIRSFEAALRFGKVTAEVWHLSEVKELAAVCLGLALQSRERDDEACHVLETALGSQPGSLRLQHHLLNLYVKQGKTEQSLALADQMPGDADQRDGLHDAIRGACEAARQDWTAALGHLQSAYASGCRSAFCLRWLAVTLLSNGEVEAARPVLDEWRQLEPENTELGAYLAGIEQAVEEAPFQSRGDAARPAKRAGDRRFRVDQGKGLSEGAPPPPVPTIGPVPITSPPGPPAGK